MATINETLSGITPSAEALPANATSEASVAAGDIVLESKAPGGDWELVTCQSGAFAIATPDPAVLYRFRGLNADVSAHVYFGA